MVRLSIEYPLTRALRLDTFEGKPVLAFVGGGGKTTTMFELASELAVQGRRVVTTTTTRLFAAQRAQSPAWCTYGDHVSLEKALQQHGQCLVTVDDDWADGKAHGLSVEQARDLLTLPGIDGLLIEADGSRMRSFKAPAQHEPVIPPEVTHVVALVGADIFGKTVTADNVHRPERVVALGGVEEGIPVTPDLVFRVLTHPEGGLQRLPEKAFFIPFLNKIEDTADALQAEETARLLLAHPRVREVLLGSLHLLKSGAADENAPRFPLHEDASLVRRSRSAAVILAAGMATRYGETKQLLDWRGKALVEHVAEVALEQCETVLVVVGHEAERVGQAIEHLPVEVIFNEQFASGQGSSLAAGAANLMGTSRPFIGEAFFLLADQPLVTVDLLQRLRKQRGLRRIAAPRYRDRFAPPVLFDRSLLPTLSRATGDVGGRAILERYQQEIAWLELAEDTVFRDVDRPADYRSLVEKD